MLLVGLDKARGVSGWHQGREKTERLGEGKGKKWKLMMVMSLGLYRDSSESQVEGFEQVWARGSKRRVQVRDTYAAKKKKLELGIVLWKRKRGG